MRPRNQRKPKEFLQVDTLEPSEGVVVLEVTGEVDVWTSPILEQALEKAMEQQSIVGIDLRNTSYLDCSGLTVIAKAWNQTRDNESDVRLIVHKDQKHFHRILEITGLDKIFEVYHSFEDFLNPPRPQLCPVT